METVVTAALIIAVITMGIVLIHQLNAQHDARIAAYRYSDALPGIDRLRAKNRRAAKPSTSPTVSSPTADDLEPSGATDDAARSPAEAVGRPGRRHLAESPELPSAGNVDVRLAASSPEAARQVAEVLRRSFASTEQRSYPVGTVADGTRLHLTVDTARAAEPGRTWPVTSQSSGDGRTQTDEI
ncbi:hypothetical protein [Streptomyces cahuitamycinicus]|uniref:hypothetical protein n=1 Tax=Streptomyces cahuitamycinicus TaxID=2070367 RepID=UPI0026989055